LLNTYLTTGCNYPDDHNIKHNISEKQKA